MRERTTATPTVDDLIGAMTHQQRLLERLLFRHAEVAMLIAAGEHRFVPSAIDEALEVEEELGAVDLARAVTAEALGMGGTVGEIAMAAADGEARHLLRLSEEMARTLAQVNTYRARAAAWAGDRATRLSASIAGGLTTGYSEDGSAA